MAVKPRVYLETTFISYLAARPSRDLIQAAHQQVTREWWDKHSADFDLFVSPMVIQESSVGDPDAAQRRLEVIHSLPSLDLTDQARTLARILLEENAIPQMSAEDAVHVALAAVHGMDYLLTWNLKHLQTRR